MFDPAEMTLPDEKQKQNPRVVVTILIVDANNATMQHGDPHHSGLLILLPLFLRNKLDKLY